MSNYLIPLFCFMLHCCHVSVSHGLNATVTPSGVTRCLREQSSVLLQLKREFSFDKNPKPNLKSYPKMKYWKAGKDCCEWDGVTCDKATGQVVGLDLSMSWLVGPFLSNSSIFSLRHLRKLNLAYNFFSWSQIPSTFAQLSRLTHLNLSYSMFSGGIPSEITWLTNLVSLDLSCYFELSGGDVDGSEFISYLNMTGVAQNMTNLKILHLDNVNLSSSLPQSFAKFSSLTSLSLSFCNLLGEFPKYIFWLPKIEIIDVSWNSMLTGSLPEFNSGSNLKSLILFGTNFSGTLPESIGNLKFLNILDLKSCKFSGTIPSSLGNLSLLTDLGLSFNNFNAQLPSTLGSLSQLTRLSLVGNNFNGQLPSTLGNLSRLSELTLEGNFNGQLPHTLGNLAKLRDLTLKNTGGGFTGEIPSSFGNLKQLETLDIKENKLSGQIPWVANLSQLKFLDLSYNSLTGAIPSSLFTIPYLGLIDLQSNQFSGPLTIENISSSQLTTLSLTENKLNGQIPRSISQLKNLYYIYLESNNFSGTLELDIFSELRMLQSLGLSGNSISLTSAGPNLTLPKLTELDLSSCNIREFPDFLKNQKKLRSLKMSHNQIEGKIPKWFFGIGIETLSYLDLSHNSIINWEQDLFILPWKILEVLDLRSNALQGPLALPPFSTKYFFISENNLSGTVHQLYCNLTGLVVLDLSNNNLSGTIPQCLVSFIRSLMVLNLQGNSFNGKIPQILLEGSKLKTLDLSHNQLQGKVPESLIKCRDLQVLNLGHNQISDTFPFWLQNLPELQVLVLRSNKFYGPIWHPQRFLGFGKLRIVDLSFNNFTGSLPSHYFKNWSAMSNVSVSNKRGLYLMADATGYYQDSVTVMNKGLEMVLVKILTIFTSIDLSHNNFSGDIPRSIGDLQSLIVLNLSSNYFEGLVPPSVGNLTELESLDLSNNKLSGRIPQELASLTFLQYLDLSHNQLTGVIPQSRHFDTFSNSSFEGNSDLCGFPLSKRCETTNETPALDHHNEHESNNGFGWKSVLVGYGCGFLVGAIGGYILLSKKPNLFIRIYGREKKR